MQRICCPDCGSERYGLAGKAYGLETYSCRDCGFVEDLPSRVRPEKMRKYNATASGTRRGANRAADYRTR